MWAIHHVTKIISENALLSQVVEDESMREHY